MKQKFKEIKRMLDQYNETSAKQETIIEVLQRETGDLKLQVVKAKHILDKKTDEYDTKIQEK